MALEFTCYHCEEFGHWVSDCPLLKPPADKASHEARIARAVERFLNLEIGPIAKSRIIKKEHDLWKKRQKELAAK